MNYIYFNESGRLRKTTIKDLYAGSANVDTMYIFADFDKDDSTFYEATLTFKLSNGFTIGPVETMPDEQTNPITDELMKCYSFVLGSDVLSVPGPIQISARYHTTYVDPITEIQEEAIKGTALVIATVHDTVQVGGGSSTALLNLNRKLNILSGDLEDHKQEFNTHDHNALYYPKNEVDANFANSLEVDPSSVINLKNTQGDVLSSANIPTVFQTTPPGNLVHSGRGMAIVDEGKTYFINSYDSVNIYLRARIHVGCTNFEYVNVGLIGTVNGGQMLEVLVVDVFSGSEPNTTTFLGNVIIDGATSGMEFAITNYPINYSNVAGTNFGLTTDFAYQVFEV